MSPPTYLEMAFAVRSAAEELQLTCSLGQGPLKACTLEAPPLPPNLIVPLYALVLQTLLPTVSQLALLHMILLLCPDHGDPPPKTHHGHRIPLQKQRVFVSRSSSDPPSAHRAQVKGGKVR